MMKRPPVTNARVTEIQDEHEEINTSNFFSWLVYVLKVILSTWLSFSFIWFFVLHRYSSWIQRSILFLHFVRWPLRSHLKTPSKYGLAGGRNFYVHSKDEVKLGVWQILPVSLADKVPAENEESFFEQSLSNGQPIMLYMHGNSGTRATFHRVELYKLLQKLNFHVITFDYRSYGDSSDVSPDELGVVDDGKTMIRWVLARNKAAPLYVWGHSLGTGISSRALCELEKEGVTLAGLILECPFNNLKDVITSHPFALCLKYMIGFNYFIIDPMIENKVSFTTDEYLAASSVKALILAAEDDWTIPIVLSRKLYKYVIQHRQNADQAIRYVQFSSKNRYGHKYICHSHDLSKIIRQFTSGQLDAIPSTAL